MYNCSDYIKDMTIGSDSYGCVAKYAKVIRTDNGSSNIVREGDYAMFKDGDEYILLGYFGDKTSLVLPEIATSINAYAFYGNQKITSVTLGLNIKTIGEYAFYDNQNITSVTIGSNVLRIGSLAFHDCGNLVEVVNKSNLNIEVGSYEYGDVAVYAQKVLTGEDEKGEVFDVGDYSFYKQGGEYILYRYNGSDKELTLPGLIDGGHTYKIGRNVFKENKKIISVVIPESVTAIGDSAFSNCQNLTSVVIGENVSTIEEHAFFYCSSLTSVVIGENVSTIGAYAFDECSKLISVEFKNPEGWKRGSTAVLSDDLKNPETAATYLITKVWNAWTRG